MLPALAKASGSRKR